MMRPESQRTMTVEEYLRFDESSQVRNEYVGGEVYAMSGVTLRHNRIVRNIVIALSASAGDGPCEVFSTDVRLRAADDLYYYPDVTVVCEPTGELDLVVTEPCVVVEVTSPSTARIDRGEKSMAYRAIASLRAYLIVDHGRRRVERHWRREAGTDWVRDEVLEDGSVSVPCLDVDLGLDVIYRRVDLAIIVEQEVADYEA